VLQSTAPSSPSPTRPSRRACTPRSPASSRWPTATCWRWRSAWSPRGR